MMFALSVLRILLALSFVFVLCSSQKSFLKGLLIGTILGHKKGLQYHEKDEHKVHYEKEPAPMPMPMPMPMPEKEYIPVPIHEEPKYYPVYIVKECPKKYNYHHSPPVHHHHHDHSHSHGYEHYESSKFADLDNGLDAQSYSDAHEEYGYASAASTATAASATKYKGTLDGYSEFGYESVPKRPNRTKNQMNDNNVGLTLSVQKEGFDSK